MSLQKWLFDSPKLSVGAQQAGYDSKSNITCLKLEIRHGRPRQISALICKKQKCGKGISWFNVSA